MKCFALRVSNGSLFVRPSRSRTASSLDISSRLFWILMRRFHKDWKDCLHIVTPQTVTRWHNQGVRYYWRWKSRAKPGRPPIPMKLIWLIKRLSRENPLWGAPRIEKELTLHVLEFAGG